MVYFPENGWRNLFARELVKAKEIQNRRQS